MNRLISYMIAAILALILTGVSARADDNMSDAFLQAENHMLVLINTARANPVQAMIEAGVDPAAVLAACPEDAEWLSGGMPPLVGDGRLKTAARAHTMDMLTCNLYGHAGSDGRIYEERIEAAGYDATMTGESLGLIAFYNYIDPAAAAETIFKNMLKDELTLAAGTRRNILDPALRDVGVGFGSGQVVINERRYNAYMATCDFGSNIVENITDKGAESTLIVLINQARMRPLDVAVSLGIDVDLVKTSDPVRYAAWVAGMPPVAKNDALTAAAEKHARDMAVHAYYSREDRSGKSYPSRIAESGYDGAAPVAELLGHDFLADGAVISTEIQRLFENLLRAELSAAPEAQTILNPAYREVGIGIEVGALPTEEGMRKALVVTLDWGGSAASPQSAEGWVYQDRDGNGLYSVGEGLFGVPVNAVGYERRPGDWIPVQVSYPVSISDGAGRFSFPGVSRTLEVQIGDDRRVIGNIHKDYKSLVFMLPGDTV
ncbi:CAP domain-containing protein [Desulfococcus sp.]|uniref:CAP domain-containing protein n=1 Tax=Desulfococcus sp. TaxID=2025834 RepID=UPI003594107A